MTIRVYLDNNATTRPYPEVVEAMRHYERELYLNASSVAGELLGAAQPLADARKAIAELLGASDDDRIVLTSGATEANAWVFHATLPGDHIVTSQVEHSSIMAASTKACRAGHPVDLVAVDSDGLIRSEELASKLRRDTKLISLQLANNETGVIQPLAALARIARKISPGALIHTDATQAIGRIPIDLADELADVDLLSFSGHKFHGPKGIGGLFLREGVELDPLIPGEQEAGQRGGTSNVPAAAGLAEGARAAISNLINMPRVSALRDRLELAITDGLWGASINAVHSPRLPNTSSVTFPDIVAENIVEQLALRGICVATGSACTAGATAPSHVLTAMGLPAADARSTLRFSLSIETSDTDINQLLMALRQLLSEDIIQVDVPAL